jgi:hypothetical protein
MAALLLLGVLAASADRRAIVGHLVDDPLVAIAPVVALPMALHRAWVGSYNTGETDKPFGVEHLIENARNWATLFKDGGRTYPYNAVVTTVEVLAFVTLFVLVAARRTTMSRAERAAFLIFASLSAGVFALYSVYFWGRPDSAMTARFYALPLFLAGLTVSAVARRVAWLDARRGFVAVASGLVLLFALPASHASAFVAPLSLRALHHAVVDYVAPQLPNKRFLIVSAVQSEFLIYDVGVMGLDAFKTARAEVQADLARKRYDEVLVVQEILGGVPTPTSAVDADVPLEMVFERTISKYGMRVRISRLKH